MKCEVKKANSELRSQERTHYSMVEAREIVIDLKRRTRTFAVDVVRFCAALSNNTATVIISRQLLRSATSVGANYRSARRAQSRKDFIAKLAIVEEEADETLYWMELLSELGVTNKPELQRLTKEAHEILSIIVASKKTVRSKLNNGG